MVPGRPIEVRSTVLGARLEQNGTELEADSVAGELADLPSCTQDVNAFHALDSAAHALHASALTLMAAPLLWYLVQRRDMRGAAQVFSVGLVLELVPPVLDKLAERRLASAAECYNASLADAQARAR